MARTQEAQQFHSQIIQFINGTIETTDCLTQKLASHDDRGFILETSVNGHSHLMDILHLSFEMTNSLGKTSEEIAHTLFDLFKTHTTADEWEELLFKKCNSSFYPLQQALMSKDFRLYKKCEDAYLEVLNQKSKPQYKKLLVQLMNMLISNNSEGFNALHSAIASNSEEMLESFLNLFQKLYNKLDEIKLVSKYDLLSLLLISDAYQNNPIHIAIFHQNNLVLKKLILRLFAISPTQNISLLHHTLNEVNAANLNILMHAVVRQDLSCLQTVFKVLKSESFSRPIYKQILLSQHQSLYSPVHLVLKTEKKEILELFYEHLIEACKTKLISEHELANVFLKNGTLTLPLLFNALLACPEVYQSYLVCIKDLMEKKIISSKEWQYAIGFQDHAGKSLWIIALEEHAPSKNLISYLKTLKKRLTTINEVEAIADLGVLGFEVLNKVIKYQDIKLFKLYFDFLLDSLKTHNLSFASSDLFYSKQNQTILNIISSFEDSEFISYFFSKLEDKSKHIPHIIKSGEKSNSAFYQLLQSTPEVLQTFFQEVKPYLSPDKFKKLLTKTPADFDQSPAYHVLANTNTQSIILYFQELKQHVTSKELVDLLLPEEEDSIVVHCLKKGNALTMAFVCEFIAKLSDKEQTLIFDSVDYENLFNHHTQGGVQFLNRYLLLVEQLIQNPKVYAKKIKSALLPKDFSCKTLLNRIIASKEYLLLEQYFNLISKAIDLKIISKDEYKNLLLSTNFQYIRPISLAISTRNPEVFLYYWKRLNAIMKKNNEFSDYVQETNLISAVSYTANLEMTKAVFESLEKLYDKQPKTLIKLFTQSCFRMVLSNHVNQEEAKNCLQYLSEQQDLLQPNHRPNQFSGFFTNENTDDDLAYTLNI